MRSACLVFLGVLFLASGALAQVQTPRYDSSIGPNTTGFYEYLPQGYATGTQRYPLILFLHGYAQCGNGSLAEMPRLMEGLTKVIQDGRFPTSFSVGGQTHRFIVLSPQFQLWPNATQIEAVLNYAVKNYRVDSTRIYLTGYSMGGGLTWEYASYTSSYANRIAAIVPVSGSSFADSARGRVIAGANVPVWATHNSVDNTVALSKTINYIAAVNTIPAPVPAAKKTIFGKVGHDAWTKTYDPLFKEGGLNVYEWMLQYRRNKLTAGSNSPVCTGSTLTLSAFAVAGATYKWTGPNGFISTQRAPSLTSVTPAAAGRYTVTLTKGDSTATATTVVWFNQTRTFYKDQDRDNYGGTTTASGCRAPAGYVITNGDCDDREKYMYPGALDVCDSIDNDCNGKIDDGPLQTYYRDYDKDGYGTPTATISACIAKYGYVAAAGDCNDRNASIFPGAPELKDSLDNNCNGIVDEDANLKTFYQDYDNDSYGNASVKKTAYLQPAGYLTTYGDCNDKNAAINPGALEIAGNGIDDNCNGQVDETDARIINVNIYGGTNAYANSAWNNWNVGIVSATNKTSPLLKYTDGSTSAISAVLSATHGLGDNGTSYGGGMAPAEVLRYTSVGNAARTLTLNGLSPARTYKLTFYTSRAKTGYSTQFSIGTTAITVVTDYNKTTAAVFTAVKPNSAGQLVISIKNINAYSYLNGFTLVETTSPTITMQLATPVSPSSETVLQTPPVKLVKRMAH